MYVYIFLKTLVITKDREFDIWCGIFLYMFTINVYTQKFETNVEQQKRKTEK